MNAGISFPYFYRMAESPRTAATESEEYEEPRTRDWWGLLAIAFPVIQVIVLLITHPRIAGWQGWVLQAGFLLITSVAGWQIVTRRRTYSLQQVFWIFVFIYFGFAPAVQCATGMMPWSSEDGATAISQNYLLQALGCTLLCLAAYSGSYYYFNRQYSARRRDRGMEKPELPLSRYLYACIVVYSAALLVALVFIGPTNLFMRDRYEAAMDKFPPTFVLFVGYVLRGAMLYLSLLGIWLYRHDRIKGNVLGLILGVTVLLNFPLAIPRFLAGAFYLSWLLASHWKVVLRRNVYAMLLLGALALAAPLSNVVRMSQITGPGKNASVGFLVGNAFLNEYDGFATLARTMKFGNERGVTMGKQAAGAVLFFVPHSVWPAKPGGSGALVYSGLGFDWTNIASPVFAEGFINFGWAGAAIFAALLAWLVAAYDAAYWRMLRSRKGVGLNYRILYYPVSLSLLLFILRGDLMSSFAYTAGLLVTGFLLHTIMIAAQSDHRKINPRGRVVNKKSSSSSSSSSSSGKSRRRSSSSSSSSSSRSSGESAE